MHPTTWVLILGRESPQCPFFKEKFSLDIFKAILSYAQPNFFSPLTEAMKLLQGHTAAITALAIHPANPRLLASASYDKTIILWDITTPSCEQILKGHSNYVTSLAFHPSDCNVLASGSHDKTIILWDLMNYQREVELKGHKSTVLSLAYCPADSNTLASASDKTIIIWDIAKGSKKATLKDGSMFFRVAFHPTDPNQLVSCGTQTVGMFQHTVNVWNIANETTTLVLKGHRNAIYGIAFHPKDSNLLASGGEDEEIIIWNLATGKEKKRLWRHTDTAFSVAFHPKNDDLFFSGGADITKWKIAKGDFSKFRGHNQTIFALVIHPVNPNRLISAGADTIIRQWDV